MNLTRLLVALLILLPLPLRADEPVRVTVPSQSGKGQAIVRCPECRIAIGSHYAGAGDRFAFVSDLSSPDRFTVATGSASELRLELAGAGR